MSELNTVSVASEVSTAIKTIKFKEKYNFKSTKNGTEALAALEVLQVDGKLKLKDTKDEDGVTVIGKQRLSEEVEFVVPDFITLLDGHGLSLNKMLTVQALVEKHIAAANKRTVDAGDFEFAGWEQVLEDGLVQRKAGIKVTALMIADAVKSLIFYLTNETSTKEGGINLTQKLALKKFTVAACAGSPLEVLERIQSLVLQWFEASTVTEQAEHSPVVELWAGELEKTINPAQEDVDITMF
jgi:hypothetical protein